MKTIKSLEPCSPARRISAVALLTISLGLASASAQGSASGSSMSEAGSSASTSEGSNSPLNRSDRHFIETVSESNQKEIAVAELAVQKSSSPEVRSYAQQIVNDHQQMAGELSQVAQRKGLSLEMSPGGHSGSHSLSIGSSNSTTAKSTDDSGAGQSGSDPTSDRHYRSLADKSGPEFDKAFVSMMVDDHRKEVKMFQKEANDASDPDVRSFASGQVSTLQQHLGRAQTLLNTVGK